MKIQISKNGNTIKNLMRAVGYVENVNRKGELNYIRPITNGTDYPRFHIYPNQSEGGFDLNLHFDAKRPSYKGANAHAGEYDGRIVEEEGEKIKRVLG